MEYCFSTRTINARPSDIRELTKAITEKGLISFAGGNPDPTLFPIEAIEKSVKEILEQDGKQALQYGPTEGYRLLENISARFPWHLQGFRTYRRIKFRS